MTVTQLWVQDTEYQAADDRFLLAALLPPGSAGPIGSAVGLRNANSLVLTMTTGFAGTVGVGAAFINYGPGIYLLANDSPAPVTFGPADPTNARIDILVAQVHDVEVGGAAGDAEIRVIPGTPAATPVQPATPAGALLLNTLRYNAGSTAPINTRIAVPLVPAGIVQRFSALYGGGSSGAGVQGITDSINIPAVHYPRAVQIRLTALVTIITGPQVPEVQIRDIVASPVYSMRLTTVNNSVTLVYDTLLPAGVAQGYQGVLVSAAGSSVTVTPNGLYGQFTGLAWPA